MDFLNNIDFLNFYSVDRIHKLIIREFSKLKEKNINLTDFKLELSKMKPILKNTNIFKDKDVNITNIGIDIYQYSNFPAQNLNINFYMNKLKYMKKKYELLIAKGYQSIEKRSEEDLDFLISYFTITNNINICTNFGLHDDFLAKYITKSDNIDKYLDEAIKYKNIKLIKLILDIKITPGISRVNNDLYDLLIKMIKLGLIEIVEYIIPKLQGEWRSQREHSIAAEQEGELPLGGKRNSSGWQRGRHHSGVKKENLDFNLLLKIAYENNQQKTMKYILNMKKIKFDDRWDGNCN